MNKKTSLYNNHLKLGAKIIPFSGFEMPVNYDKGILSEYQAVRNNCGMFDVSHMGQFFIHGANSCDFLQEMTINNVSNLNDYDAQYSAMCNREGGIIDDLILYKQPNGYFMVVNAGNINKNFDWLNKNIINDVTIENQSSEISLIAIQGPNTRKFLSQITNSNLNIKFYSYTKGQVLGTDIMISRTGYTGELGFELYGTHDQIVDVWDKLIQLGVEPCGLASRDILRMEMKYCLYGNDIDETTSPIEAGLSWITDMDKKSFIGKNQLIKNKSDLKLIAFKMCERGIPRKDYDIRIDNKKVGRVTSGTQSFTLNSGIGIGYIESKYSSIGKEIQISIRNNNIKAEIIKPPFIKKTSLLK